jgi:FAD/FMN-containing dehydrogenase
MAMESLGGNMPAGQPAVVSMGNVTHVFAIATNGAMNHWKSVDGGPWSGPTPLPSGGTLEASFPCALALADGSLHVFAIAHGGPLCHWRSADGTAWAPPQIDNHAQIPGNGNGVAAVSRGGSLLDAFASTPAGIVQYTLNSSASPLVPGPMLPNSNGLNRCVLAACSVSPTTMDVFSVEPNVGMPLRWHFDGARWTRTMLPGPPLHFQNNNNNQNLNAFAAVCLPSSSTIELFAVTANMQVTQWSVTGNASTSQQLPASPWPLAEGVVAAVVSPLGLDVFATGHGSILQGGPLVRWHFDGAWHPPVKYDSGLAAGGIRAAWGAAGLEAFGFQSGSGGNPLLHWPAGISVAKPDGWVNWAGTQHVDHPQGHCYPTCLEELAQIVKSATQQGKMVRAVGSSWSFSDIAVTPGYIVETNAMNHVLTQVIPQAQSAKAVSMLTPRTGRLPLKPIPFHLVHVEAGIKLEDLMDILDNMNLGPGTMGGSAGQTVAGVISTSVHGSHYKLPPVPDWVRAIHLVGPDGKQYWIEPADRPVTDPTKLPAVLGPLVTIKYDDDWFDTALVSVGSLGIVYSIIIEARDAYKITATRSITTWSALRPQLSVANSANLFQTLDGVQLAIDPGSLANADPTCILEERQHVSMATPSSGPANFDPLAAFCEGDGLPDIVFHSATAAGLAGPVLASLVPAVTAVQAALAPAVLPVVAPLIAPLLIALGTAGSLAAALPIVLSIVRLAGPGALGDVVGHVLDGHPQLIAPVISALTKAMQPTTPTTDLAHKAMAPKNKGECASRGFALEVAIDTSGDMHLTFTDAAIALLRSEALKGNYLGGWFSLRFVGTSRAILSPQHSSMTCMAEFVGLRTLSSTQPLLLELERLARTQGAIQHWAMCQDLRDTDVTRAYPRLATWRQVRNQLTKNGTVQTFDNAFTKRVGLSS